jgi:lantibiotic modifying enzyme
MSSDPQFLEAAVSIAREIAATVVWEGARCSWMGAVAEPALSSRVEYHTLGPSLYGGTAGVGLFLAHAAAATGEELFRDTAVGALRHATSRASALPPARRDGFYAGALGTAWAAADAARLLEESELRERARAVLDDAQPPSGPDRCPDLVTGLAGSILGLLALAYEFHDPRLIEDALRAGDTLIDHATITSHGWSWAIPGRRHPAHLCGIAHGAAGIAWALLELFAATGERRVRDVAIGAFTYERSWLDAESGRWPDLRVGRGRRGPLATFDSGIAGTWCYGEAGIAFTRLRAAEVLGVGDHSADGEIALETTRRCFADSLPHAISDVSLCHGRGGAADVLQGAAVGGVGRWGEVTDLLTEFGHVVLERYRNEDDRWPCGVDGATTPGLFLGLSGIGWLLLRLHDAAIPSPLAPKIVLNPCQLE